MQPAERVAPIWRTHATIFRLSGKSSIRAKTPYRVKHLHGNPRPGAGIDARPRTVDNRAWRGCSDLQSRRSEKNLSTMSVDLWQRGCERLAAELPEQQFNTWIRPLPPADVSDSESGAVVSLRVSNRFKLDWIRSQYANRIEGLLSELAGKPIRLELSLAPRDGAIARPGLGLLMRGAEGHPPAPAADWLHAALPMMYHWK